MLAALGATGIFCINDCTTPNTELPELLTSFPQLAGVIKDLAVSSTMTTTQQQPEKREKKKERATPEGRTEAGRARSRSRERVEDTTTTITATNLITKLQRADAKHAQITQEHSMSQAQLVVAEANLARLRQLTKDAKAEVKARKELCEQKKKEMKKSEKKRNALRLEKMEEMETMNTENTRLIDRDSLHSVFSYLDFDDWRQSQMWLVCQSWYHTLKKSHSLRVECDLFTSWVNKECRLLFVASPFLHHFTRMISIASDAAVTLLSSLQGIEALTLTKLPKDSDLSPLFALARLTHFTTWSHCASSHLQVIRQLPALIMFQQGHVKNQQRLDHHQLKWITTEPTNVAQWLLLDISGESVVWPKMMDFVIKFKSVRYLNLGCQSDPDGKLAQLQHLQELTLEPFWDHELGSKLDTRSGMMTNVSNVKLVLNGYFANPVDVLEDGQYTHDVPDLDDATIQLKNMFVSAAARCKLTSLHIDAAYILTDLSCLASLLSLRSLTFTRCWMIDTASVTQLAVLKQLESLTIVFDFEITDTQRRYIDETSLEDSFAALEIDVEARYQELESLLPQLTPPSSLIPSLRTFKLNQKDKKNKSWE